MQRPGIDAYGKQKRKAMLKAGLREEPLNLNCIKYCTKESRGRRVGGWLGARGWDSAPDMDQKRGGAGSAGRVEGARVLSKAADGCVQHKV